MKAGLLTPFNNVAALLAHEDATIQAEFFNVFAKELNTACVTHFAAEIQATAIRGHLTDAAKEVCETLCWKDNQ